MANSGRDRHQSVPNVSERSMLLRIDPSSRASSISFAASPRTRFTQHAYPRIHRFLLSIIGCSLVGLIWFRKDPVHNSVIPEVEEKVAAPAPTLFPACDVGAKFNAGYMKLPNKEDDHYFYWFYESKSNPSADSLILWLTGGPGCSGSMAMLQENGPCLLENNGTFKNNAYSWTDNANVIWIDQPTNVGFSSGLPKDEDHFESDVAPNLYYFLQEFYKRHPELQSNPFFIFAESYGGHYAPTLANYIVHQNLKLPEVGSDLIKIPLEGIGIGNGLTNPEVQYKYAVDMAVNNPYNVTMVSPETYDSMKEAVPDCIELIQQCQTATELCLGALQYCNSRLFVPLLLEGKRNPYDIRLPCHEIDLTKCYDMSAVTSFLNNPSVQRELGVEKAWKECNYGVTADFMFDYLREYQQDVAYILEHGVRVLIYAGDADAMCNWEGNQAWVNELTWSGKSLFNAASKRPFRVDNVEKGTVQSANGLSFIRVYNAGHMLPMDQPEAALEMLNRFLRNQQF